MRAHHGSIRAGQACSGQCAAMLSAVFVIRCLMTRLLAWGGILAAIVLWSAAAAQAHTV